MKLAAKNRPEGFSLIEMVVVLAVAGLIATLVPQGLQRLYSSASLDNVAYTMAARLRDCSQSAQQLQRSLTVGTAGLSNCSLVGPDGYRVDFESNTPPVFHADGTSNGITILISDSANQVAIKVNRISSNVSVDRDAKP